MPTSDQSAWYAVIDRNDLEGTLPAGWPVGARVAVVRGNDVAVIDAAGTTESSQWLGVVVVGE